MKLKKLFIFVGICLSIESNIHTISPITYAGWTLTATGAACIIPATIISAVRYCLKTQPNPALLPIANAQDPAQTGYHDFIFQNLKTKLQSRDKKISIAFAVTIITACVATGSGLLCLIWGS